MAAVEERYGEALLEIAVQEKREKQYLEEVKVLRNLFDENPALLTFYTNPKITQSEKEKVTEKCFKDGLSPEIAGLITVLIRNGRASSILKVLEWFTDAIKEKLNIGVVYVESATEISDRKKKEIEKRLLETTTFSSLEMNYDIKPEIIGGLRIRIKDRIVDNSIRTKLQNMSNELRQIRI